MFCVLLFIAVLMQSSRQDEFQSTIQNRSYCLAPQYRSAEIFKVDGVPVIANSIIYQSFFLTVTCPTGYKLVGKKVTRCVDGQYLEPYGSCFVIEANNATASTDSKLCEVPHHPKHGSYSFTGKAHPNIELAYFEFHLELKCNHGYTLQGENYVGCYNGSWSQSMPTCLSKYGYIADPLESGKARLTYCKPPDNIKHGSYVVEGDSHPFIPNAYTKFYVFVTCNDGYRIYGEDFVRCQSGVWSAEMPICGLPCQLKKDPRVEYFCENGKNMETCKDYVNPGEIVTPVCKDNVTRDDITVMRCGENGYFDHVETCASENMATECGLVTVSDGLIIGGYQVEHGEVPWHAGVYTKTTEPSMQICGGTIVSATSVVSAAHCFWSDNTQVKPATEYAVAVGKIYRPWNDPHDIHAQKSDVLEIKIPILYFGSSANYQNDIAVLKLATSIKFNRFIRPICLDFTEDLYSSQLEGLGKVAGWGLKTEEGNPSQTLKAVFLPVVALDKCVNESPVAFKPYITADKICAGYTNGTAVCKGDSGGGLVFHRIQNGVYKYYLHGIVSTAPNYGLQRCNAFTWATFTSIAKHKGFVYSNIK